MLINPINQFKSILPAKNSYKTDNISYAKKLHRDTVSFGNSREEIVDMSVKLAQKIMNEVNKEGTTLSLEDIETGRKIFEYCKRTIQIFKKNVSNDPKASDGADILSQLFEKTLRKTRIYKIADTVERSTSISSKKIMVTDFIPGIHKSIIRTPDSTKTVVQDIRFKHFSEITHISPQEQTVFEFAVGKTEKYAITFGDDGSIYDVSQYLSPKEKEYILISPKGAFEGKTIEPA